MLASKKTYDQLLRTQHNYKDHNLSLSLTLDYVRCQYLQCINLFIYYGKLDSEVTNRLSFNVCHRSHCMHSIYSPSTCVNSNIYQKREGSEIMARQGSNREYQYLKEQEDVINVYTLLPFIEIAIFLYIGISTRPFEGSNYAFIVTLSIGNNMN